MSDRELEQTLAAMRAKYAKTTTVTASGKVITRTAEGQPAVEPKRSSAATDPAPQPTSGPTGIGNRDYVYRILKRRGIEAAMEFVRSCGPQYNLDEEDYAIIRKELLDATF